MSNREQMQAWQEDWLRAAEDFAKPQIIVDAKSDIELFNNLHDNVNDPAKLLKSLKTDFAENPTHFATLGPDSRPHVTPDFSDGPILRELNALKLSLHELEDKVNAAFTNSKEKEEDKLKKEINSIRSKIDDLSNKLAPNPIADYS